MSALPAKAGWAWLKQGMGLFRKQPAALSTLLFTNVLLSLAISAVPILGQIAAVVLIPSFSMSFMQACLMIERGERVTPLVLLTGFRKPVVAKLCKIGLAYLAVTAVIVVFAYFIFGDAIWKPTASPVNPANPANPAVVDRSELLGLMVIAVLQIAAVMVLCFSAPLAYWQKMSPGKAVFFSFFAVLRSARVFIVMLLAWFALFMASTTVLVLIFGNNTFGRVAITWLGFLFILLLQCGMYAGYRQIFGVPLDSTSDTAA
jgi:hypothetical protein